MKTVLITGANGALGLNLVGEFRRRGHTVVGTYRRSETSEDLLSLASRDEGVIPIRVDVRCQQDVDALAQEVQERLGRVDILVHNTGIPAAQEALHEVRAEQLMEHLDVHAVALVRLAGALVPMMTDGLIVNISSVLGSLEGMGCGYPVYAPAKTLANAFARQLSACLRSRDIAVVSLHPGVFRSRIGFGGDPGAAAKNVVARVHGLGMKDTGTFLDAATGRPIPW